MFKLSKTSLENIDFKKSLKTKEAGAFVCFEGWVRNHNNGQKVKALEYEAHATLCKSEAKKIIDEVHQKFDIIKVKCTHRIGTLSIGEMAVWGGVTSAHRDEAFKACRYLIDEVKKRLPIWKKEHYVNNKTHWINSTKSDLKK